MKFNTTIVAVSYTHLVYKQRKTSKCKGKYKRYMIHKKDTAYKIFKKYGFSWGGEWRSSKDYQHFEVNK